MKMVREFTLMLALLIGLACSVPFSEELGDELQMSQWPENVQMSQWPENVHNEGRTTDAPPTPYGDSVNVESQGVSVQTAGRCSPVNHGSTVAFQASYDKRSWLGCAPQSFCAKATCPRLLMSTQDFGNCYGERFTIYRKSGPGSVLVGDEVGILYQASTKWFGCPEPDCDLRPCPGAPHSVYGMSDPSKWTTCYGEVFRIYSEGKELGHIVENHDKIMLYYQNGNDWVGLVDNDHANHRTCPGTTFPPGLDKFDTCWGEIFEITVRQN